MCVCDESKDDIRARSDLMMDGDAYCVDVYTHNL